LTVTDIATGWTENRSVPDKTAKCVLAALNDIARKMPFPILGVDSDNRIRIHQRPVVGMAPRTPDHVHPRPTGQ
jgi:hypothetical protein